MLIFLASEKEGLSPMKRTHIHFAQHHSHIKGVNAPPGASSSILIRLYKASRLLLIGLRNNSQVLIHIDLDRALQAGIPFLLSANGVVLSKGDESGYLRPEFFKHVTDARGDPVAGWTTASNMQAASEEVNCKSSDPVVTASTTSVSGGSDVGLPDPATNKETQPMIPGDVASTVDRLSNVEVKDS